VLSSEGVAGVESAIDHAHEWRDIEDLYSVIRRCGAA
jgi:hypothetical protein